MIPSDEPPIKVWGLFLVMNSPFGNICPMDGRVLPEYHRMGPSIRT
jgi:hypothetical protein